MITALALWFELTAPFQHCNMSSKRITSFTAQLVTFDTPLPYSEVVKRFEQEVNKPLAQSKDFLLKLKNAASKTEIEDLVNSVRGDHDFV